MFYITTWREPFFVLCQLGGLYLLVTIQKIHTNIGHGTRNNLGNREDVPDHQRDTGILLLLLFVCLRGGGIRVWQPYTIWYKSIFMILVFSWFCLDRVRLFHTPQCRRGGDLCFRRALRCAVSFLWNEAFHLSEIHLKYCLENVSHFVSVSEW